MKRVLFLCTGNSCRSQMAEGWLRHLGGGDYEVYSAGTRPAGQNPLALRAMAEAGVDISRQASKHVEVFAGQSFDWVITVCDHARESCPVFPGPVRRLHWSFADPAATTGTLEERLPFFRQVRDQVRGQIKDFIRAGEHRGLI